MNIGLTGTTVLTMPVLTASVLVLTVDSYWLQFEASAYGVVGDLLGRRRFSSLYPGRNDLDHRLRLAVFGAWLERARILRVSTMGWFCLCDVGRSGDGDCEHCCLSGCDALRFGGNASEELAACIFMFLIFFVV